MFTAISIDSDKNPFSDKILLPQDVLDSIVNSSRGNMFNTSKPLLFKLTAYEISGKQISSCVVGVREFSLQDPQAIQIPWYIASKMMLLDRIKRDGILIECSLCDSVPSGTSISLEPVGIVLAENARKNPDTYLDDSTVDENFPVSFVDNEFSIKSFLEARLNNAITTVVKGDCLMLSTEPNGEPSEKVYKFKVHDVEPENIVCVVNTDVDLDVIKSVKVPIGVKGQTLERNKSPLEDELNSKEGKIVDVQVGIPIHLPVNDRNIYRLVSPNGLELRILENDIDEPFQILLGRDDTIDVDCYFTSTNETFSKTAKAEININTPVDIPELEEIFIKPCFYGTTNRQIFSFIVDKKELKTHEKLLPDRIQCPYCELSISQSAITLHELHCSRSTQRCGTCGKLYLQSKSIPLHHWHCSEGHELIGGDSNISQERHRKLFHEETKCVLCDEMFLGIESLTHHKHNECSMGKHYCKFCHLCVLRGEQTIESNYYGLSPHEVSCGVKTVECYKCKKTLKRLELKHHLDIHELERKSKGIATDILVCSNVNCCKTQQYFNNNRELCDVCFGPFYSTNDDPNDTQFMRKLERKYVIQISRGCGSTFCKNKECKSSGLSSFSDMGKIIHHVQEQLLAPKECRYWLCVDEATTKRKILADTYCEIFPLKYNSNWVYHAVNQAPVRNLESLEHWLKENAVTNEEI